MDNFENLKQITIKQYLEKKIVPGGPRFRNNQTVNKSRSYDANDIASRTPQIYSSTLNTNSKKHGKESNLKSLTYNTSPNNKGSTIQNQRNGSNPYSTATKIRSEPEIRIKPSIHLVGLAPNSYQDIESESEEEIVEENPWQNAMTMKKNQPIQSKKMNMFVKVKNKRLVHKSSKKPESQTLINSPQLPSILSKHDIVKA